MKKVIMGLAGLLMAGSLFAQVTNLKGILNAQTNYIDVNNWQTVNPEKLFLTANFSSTSTLNAGAAKNFKKLYTAVSYYGPLWANDSISYTKTASTKTDNWLDSTVVDSNDSSRSHKINLLFGNGNLAVAPFFEFVLDSDGNSESTVGKNSDGDETKSIYNYNDYTYGVKVGYNYKDFKLKAQLSGVTDMNKHTTYTDEDNYSITNYSTTTITGLFGFTTSKGDKIKQTYGGTVKIGGVAYPEYASDVKSAGTRTTTKNNHKSDFIFDVCPTYKVELNPAKNLYLGANAYAWINFDAGETEEDVSYAKIAVYPYAFVYLNYEIKPQIKLFVTWANYLPDMNFTWGKNTAVSNTKVNTFNFVTGSYSNYLSTGFGWYINENTVLNLSLDIFDLYNRTSLWSLVNNSFTVSAAMKF